MPFYIFFKTENRREILPMSANFAQFLQQCTLSEVSLIAKAFCEVATLSYSSNFENLYLHYLKHPLKKIMLWCSQAFSSNAFFNSYKSAWFFFNPTSKHYDKIFLSKIPRLQGTAIREVCLQKLYLERKLFFAKRFAMSLLFYKTLPIMSEDFYKLFFDFLSMYYV